MFGGSLEAAALVDYLEHPDTLFDVHKGAGVSFRPWDHQLRQPLYLVKVDPETERAWDLAALVDELPAGTAPGTDPIARLDRLGDLGPGSSCRWEAPSSALSSRP